MNNNMIIEQRVKHYPLERVSLGWMTPRIESIISDKQSWSEYKEINDIIELYEIQKIIESSTVLQEKYSGVVPEIKKVVGIFFSKINSQNINKVLSAVDEYYKDEFWEIISAYCVYKRIDGVSFEKLIDNNAFDIINVLHQKKLTFLYGNEIRNHLLSDASYGRLLIKEYLEKKDTKNKTLHFPQCMTAADRVSILWKYLDCPEIGINELELISKTRGDNQLPISPELMLAAKRKHKDRISTLFKEVPTMVFGTNVIFKKQLDSEKDISFTDGILQTVYDLEWIQGNCDYPTILNNFIYVFGYVDRQFRWIHVSKPAYMGTFERLLGLKGKREYLTGTGFNTVQMLGNAQMQGYCYILDRLGIDIEESVRWFFDEYLPIEFNVNGFIFNKPSTGISFLEKCRDLVIEIDSILKQFTLFCKYEEIDRELFEIYTEHMLIANVPSMLKDKYIYYIHDNFSKASNLLFSDQSILNYIEGRTKGYHSFYEALLHTSINKSDLQPFQQIEVEWLINKGIIFIDDNGTLLFDKELLWLMHDLYFNECSCIAYLKGLEKQISYLNSLGMIRYGSSLLSEPEQNYFNYIFNNAEYDNSMDLRNKYAHGNQMADEDFNRNNYYIILRMLILIIIKINEELCLLDEQKQDNELGDNT